MSPRKERYQTPTYVAQGIRDKRKKLLHGAYCCPNCGKDKLMIQIDKSKKEIIAECPCGVKQALNYIPAFEAVDYFSKFTDQYRRINQKPKP